MEGKRLIKSIRLKNLLSFGSKGEEIELEPLNVLIGRNASGKSNFIEAIRLLRSTPRNIGSVISMGGGISEWIWKGESTDSIAQIEAEIEFHQKDKIPRSQLLRHSIHLAEIGQRYQIVKEFVDELLDNSLIETARKIQKNKPLSPKAATKLLIPIYKYEKGRAMMKPSSGLSRTANTNVVSGFAPELESKLPAESILSLLRDPQQYPEITYLGDIFKEIKIYSQWDTGRKSVLRTPQRADEINDFLEESAINLGLVLNYLQRKRAKNKIIEKLKDFYREAEDYLISVVGGTVQVLIQEEGFNDPIPATRLSDGTLRYLCLLTILCHPSPPPLICIEEPELGLHPDVLHTVAKLLIEASQRTQLIVTTHSDILVSALSEAPESVLVCERDGDGTHMRRLEPKRLKEWLKKYSLGDLWMKGELGGV